MKESETRELFFTPEETGSYLFESFDWANEEPYLRIYQEDIEKEYLKKMEEYKNEKNTGAW